MLLTSGILYDQQSPVGYVVSATGGGTIVLGGWSVGTAVNTGTNESTLAGLGPANGATPAGLVLDGGIITYVGGAEVSANMNRGFTIGEAARPSMRKGAPTRSRSPGAPTESPATSTAC